MSEVSTTEHPAVVGKLSTLDRFLPVWIGVAMVAGLLLGRMIPGLGDALSAVEIDGISLPIALGLLIMMYPVLAKVRYDRLDTVTGDRKLLIGSLVLNWVLGPALMFALAWLLLPDLPEYRTGLIIVGCDKSNDSEMSHTQASPPAWLAIRLSRRRRTGSPRALNIRARSPAQSSVNGSRASGEQHAPPSDNS